MSVPVSVPVRCCSCFVAAALLLAVTVKTAVADVVYSSVTLVSSSEPVPVLDMVSGWDGPFEAGEYAYADARVTLALRLVIFQGHVPLLLFT